MTSSRAAVAAALAIATAVTATGCTDSNRPRPRPSSPSASAPDVELTPPELRPGHRQIASDGPRRGSWDLGPVQLSKGITWVNVNCVSDKRPGRITLTIDTVGQFVVDCPTDEARIGVNQLDLADSRKGRLHIETTDDVRWTADIQVPK